MKHFFFLQLMNMKIISLQEFFQTVNKYKRITFENNANKF